MIKKIVLVCATSIVLVAGTGVATTADAVAVKKFSNCTKLNKTYAHGVGKQGARDHVSGSSTPVTTFKRNTTVYNQNTARDGDKDGIACEKR
jgi:hypothetical protein